MPRAATGETALHDLVRQCTTSLDAPDLQTRLLRSLRRLLPVDAAFFATADPHTLLFTGVYAEDPLRSVTSMFLDNEFGAGDVNAFAALANSPRHVATLDGVTHDDRSASPRYLEIMRPLGLGDELRAALVVDSECWGYLCLHRTDDPSGFTPAERALIERAAPHIGRALRHSLLLRASATATATTTTGATATTTTTTTGATTTTSEDAGPGVVLLADDLSLIATTPRALELLSLVEDGPRGLPLPMCVYAVAAALRTLENGAADVTPTTRVRTRSGQWLGVHASRLHGPPAEQRITVVIESAGARATAPLLFSAYGVSRRESEVATLVLRGSSTREISATLHISANTVQDHLKSVFDKVGVRSRRELVGRMLG
jgi:DNA-binding CsgD family transcriptional regulator